MNGYLVDTSVLSALAPGRPEGVRVRDWFFENGATVFISTMSVAEIAKGIAKLRRNGANGRTDALSDWLEGLLLGYRDRILPFCVDAARLAGAMDDAAVARGRHPGLADVVIAATAAAHGLVVATANERHFRDLGASCVNPLAPPGP
ncbi:MAG: type II toxin-antitoxin system VapC family toxin [Mesorhizobium sp.]